MSKKIGPGLLEFLEDGHAYEYGRAITEPYELTQDDKDRFDKMNLDPEERKVAENVFISMKPQTVHGHEYSIKELTNFLDTIWKTNEKPFCEIFVNNNFILNNLSD